MRCHLLRSFTSSLFLIVLLFCIPSSIHAQPVRLKPNKSLLQQIQKNYKDAVAQYAVLMKNLPPDRFPRNYNPAAGKLETSDGGWWCSGFYPGTLLYLYEKTREASLLREAKRILQVLEPQKLNTTTHDLGFMMFCSFGNAERLFPSAQNRDILLTSARSLSSRFNPAVGCIKSWDSKDPNDFLVIIDNMMNLELLFWATTISGDSSFYKIAVTHANTTLQHHFRPDNSSWHVVNYDATTGAVRKKRTAQGFADSSAWARGQTWGLYGYTATYRETKDKRYLEQAEKIADFLVHHSHLPADKIPYWDFNAPDLPHALRDASAGSIMAAGLLELCKYTDAKRVKEYFSVAETILRTLSTDHYKAAAGANGGFLLQHSVGHLPAKSEVDVALTYADYYFVEAMIRYQSFQ